MLTNLTIALDMMGGDYGPRSSIPAAVNAVNANTNLRLILCGNQQVILKELEALDSLSHPRLIIRHCSEVVTNRVSLLQRFVLKKNHQCELPSI